MYHYELLCLDADRTRSVWLTHTRAFTGEELDQLLRQVQTQVPHEVLAEWATEARHLHESVLSLGQSLGVEPALLTRLERRLTASRSTFSDVVEPLIDRLCLLHGFTRLMPAAVVVRYGNEPLAA